MKPAVMILLLLFLLGANLSAGRANPPPHGQGTDCSLCHACDQPTRKDPCLQSCPRNGHQSDLSPQLGPEVVILDALEDLYVAVRFNHKAHATMVGMNGGCETCHHYTPPDMDHPGCKDCHPTAIVHENISQPGLKGAYHRQCMNCHTEWDKDTACEICHEKKAGGRLHGEATEVSEHSHYEPIEMMELLMFDTGYEEGDKVPFHHLNHSQKYERNCAECHQEQSCSRCHVHGQESHPMGELADRNLHDTCFNCHHEERCNDCHGRDPDDLFEHSDTGWGLQGEHADLNCRACHGESGAFSKLTPVCETCHRGDWNPNTFDHAMTGAVLDEVHSELDCGDCHEDSECKAASCEACHDDGRVYSRSTGFGDQ